MDGRIPIVKPFPKQGLSEHVRAAPGPVTAPVREQAEAHPHLDRLCRRHPDPRGLLETPKRVIAAYEESIRLWNAREVLDRTFSETGGYDTCSGQGHSFIRMHIT